MEISLSPVIVMVMVLFCWARAGKETAKASIMTITILVIAIFICPSGFTEPLYTALGQSSWNESAAIKCYNPPQFLSRPLSAYSLTARGIFETRLLFAE
jgi:hypothetical protein